ncbi:putative membrane protein [Desulfobaculum xiamenense]|uniref:Putative membrane protein n=1 Tax=Desulfobaculum xiamenense TaxID=995050 RepID=A0A846QMA1_9BACT|nr:hypothetical protein [Desulfobaculum xiamenense]NJB67353.1 putative membrane protein [Desulfobaculum xiamenense]
MRFFSATPVVFCGMLAAVPAAAADGGLDATLWMQSGARIVAMVVFFGVIIAFLRYLYGPGGRLRPAEFGTGHIEARNRRKAEEAALRRALRKGEISSDEYLRRIGELDAK